MTPEALVLPLRFDSLVSLTSMPWTAESTLVSGSDMLEMCRVCYVGRSKGLRKSLAQDTSA
jgi:hypothetical protein